MTADKLAIKSFSVDVIYKLPSSPFTATFFISISKPSLTSFLFSSVTSILAFETGILATEALEKEAEPKIESASKLPEAIAEIWSTFPLKAV